MYREGVTTKNSERTVRVKDICMQGKKEGMRAREREREREGRERDDL